MMHVKGTWKSYLQAGKDGIGVHKLDESVCSLAVCRHTFDGLESVIRP